jgi:hypothetical protein
MQMHFKHSDSTEIVDALEFAIMVINADVADARIAGMVVTRAVETLQVLRATFGIAAAKEQRKGRANQACQWAGVQHALDCKCHIGTTDA